MNTLVIAFTIYDIIQGPWLYYNWNEKDGRITILFFIKIVLIDWQWKIFL